LKQELWNKLPDESKTKISFNAFALTLNNGEETLLSNHSKTMSMLTWAELTETERNTIEEYTKGY
jgi:hypothetical protein